MRVRKAISPGGRPADDSPLGTPGNKRNWVDNAGGLPKYIREIAHALIRKGMLKAHAIATAVNRVRKLAAFSKTPSVKAAAAAAAAQWEAMKAKSVVAKAFGCVPTDLEFAEILVTNKTISKSLNVKKGKHMVTITDIEFENLASSVNKQGFKVSEPRDPGTGTWSSGTGGSPTKKTKRKNKNAGTVTEKEHKEGDRAVYARRAKAAAYLQANGVSGQRANAILNGRKSHTRTAAEKKMLKTFHAKMGNRQLNATIERSHGKKVRHAVKKSNAIEFDVIGDIEKSDDEQQLVFGWASVASKADGTVIVDKQGDVLDNIDQMEKVAYDFVLTSRDGGEMHIRKGVSTLVESFVATPEKCAKMGIPPGTLPTGWWVGFKVNDTEVWKSVKSGKYRQFSVHGSGMRKALADA